MWRIISHLQTVHLMMRFPKVGALNVATDRRRLQYLAYNLQEDLKVVYQSRYVDEGSIAFDPVISVTDWISLIKWFVLCKLHILKLCF